MNVCVRCGGQTSWTSDKVKLFGGVVTHICVECETDWAAYLRELPLWDEYLVVHARTMYYNALTQAQQPPSEEQMHALVVAETLIKNRAFGLGRDFVATKITRESTVTHGE